jgi:hypothetical protein
MTHESRFPPPDDIAELHQVRDELIDMIEINRHSIVRCEEMLTRVDEILETLTDPALQEAQTAEQTPARTTFLQRLTFRKAS